jgi:hypothetical protein
MTIEDIILANPNIDTTQTVLFANEQCVYDYKESIKSIKLISNDDCFNLEQVSLYELIEYSDECSFSIEDSFLKDEQTGEYFTSYDINGNKLNLKY